uniref:Uncharacterized protein n=1 Tax=Triticum urartu TaxID=4572 RepID=A0A8R7P4G1_TRIUA
MSCVLKCMYPELKLSAELLTLGCFEQFIVKYEHENDL